MNNDIILKIKSLFPNFTKSEKKVALFMNDQFNKISYLSINDIAAQCTVGEATIMRFCKRLGYSGFYEFKQQVVLEMQRDERKLKDKYQSQALNQIETMIKETVQLSNKETIEKAADLIIESQNIYLFGTGFSGLSAQATQIRLTSFGYKAVAVNEEYLQILTANIMNSHDLAIGFSISGENETTVKNLSQVKMNGAKVISLTNHEKSSMAMLSDVVLLTAGKELGKEGSTLITEMSQFIVLEQLFEKLHELDKDKIEQMSNKIHYIINGE